MKDKEIELKFVITPKTRQTIINDLNNLNLTPKTTHQIDTYYIPDFREFEVNGETMECVRIRETDKGSVLCYKKIHRECNPVYCDEYETVIESKDQMEKILFALGFSIQMTIDKTRETYKFNNLEFDFDSVENLGELLEIEIKDENLSLDEIFDFISKYGLSKNDVNYKGIQVLMKEAMKNSK